MYDSWRGAIHLSKRVALLSVFLSLFVLNPLLSAVNISQQSPGPGTLKWKFFTSPDVSAFHGDVNSSPTVGADGTIYFGSDDYNLYALNSDGSLKWTFPTGDEVQSSPVLDAEGTIYFSSEDSEGSDGMVHYDSYGNNWYHSYLYAFHSDGSLKWRYRTGGNNVTSIGVDDTIYIGSDDGNPRALNPDGSLKWKFHTGYRVLSSPALGADGTIYFGSNDSLYALHRDGLLWWKFKTGGLVNSSPAVGVDGTVYVGSDDNHLYAINGSVRGRSRWSMQGHDPQHSGRVEGGGFVDETLSGDDGSNVILGLTGDDRIFGLGGDDTLDGGPGLDSIDGGSGNDTIILNPGDVPAGSVENIVCGRGLDTVILKDFPADTPMSFPITDPITSGNYENSTADCEVVKGNKGGSSIKV